MFHSAFSSIVSMAYGPQPTTIADVMRDIGAISADIIALKDVIEAYPLENGGVAAALLIHANSVNLSYAIATATTDVTNVAPLPISDEDSEAILKAIEDLLPNIVLSTNTIAAKKSAFAALPAFAGVPAYIKHDLQVLLTCTNELQAALIEKSPARLHESVNKLKKAIEDAFETAITAYAEEHAT